jgi:SAM-dependent methyltransferase
VAPLADTPATYETIGVGYQSHRVADARLERQVHAALGGAGTVLNVGAGAGSYEPRGCAVVAVEPSRVMLAQRPAGAAPALRGVAEALPFADRAFDAALAVLTVHHWADPSAGLAELRRVARRQVVFHFDLEVSRAFWLAEYFPEAWALEGARTPTIDEVTAALGGAQRVRVEPVPVPHDCTDGFGAAYWRRPGAYLDPAVRAGISSLAQLEERATAPGLARLRADLESGAWHDRHAELLDLDEYDGGYRLIVAG